MSNVNGVGLTVLILLFALVTVMGFMAAKWRRPKDLQSLHEVRGACEEDLAALLQQAQSDS